MATLAHVYLTAHGSYSSGAWAGETAQIGLRLPYVPVIGAPDKGAVFTPQANGDIVADSGSEVGTHGTLARTWTARVGPTGSGQNCDAGAQIDMAEDFWTFLNALKAQQINTFRWTHIKISGVDTTGATPQNSSIYTFSSPLAGTASSALPPQIALAVSLRANLVGRRGRGRVYLPALYSSYMDTAGTVSATPAASVRGWLKDLIDDLQEVTGTPDYIPIVSVMSADSATAVRPLEIRTGNRFDTIQSRRRQVAESYTVTSL